MKTVVTVLTALIAISVVASTADAGVTGPYSSDANTLALFHFDEVAGALDPGNPFVNFGTGGASLNLTNTGGPDGRDNTGPGGYGAAGFTGFGSAFDTLGSGNGVWHNTTNAAGGGATTGSTLVQGSLQGATGAFTYEALIKLSGITNEQEILSHDGSSTRGFLFRALSGTMAFFDGTNSFSAPIPTTGDHAFVANNWYHVAIVYSGDEGISNNTTFYWTALNSSATTANPIGTATLTADMSASGSNLFGVGTTTRSPFRFEVAGFVDEVRISGVARGADQFLFVPEPATGGLLGLGLLVMATRRRRRAGWN